MNIEAGGTPLQRPEMHLPTEEGILKDVMSVYQKNAIAVWKGMHIDELDGLTGEKRNEITREWIEKGAAASFREFANAHKNSIVHPWDEEELSQLVSTITLH
jgi:predicted RecB family nuclease